MESKSKRSRDFSAYTTSGGNNNSIILQEEETGDEICSSFVVAAALNGDPQAIDMYLSSFPPSIRFAPHDYELVEHYLYNKINNQPLPINNIIELDIYKHNPYDLAAMYKPLSNYDGKKRWYFITPRDRKYPKGNRPNRAAADGYWKATGADTPIECKNIIANKKALVFYKGKAKPPGGVKTNWIMYEYTIESTTTRAKTHADDMRLDDYVLVRIHEKPPPKAGATRSKVGGNNKAPKPNNARNKAPKAKRFKAAVVDHADNNQIVAMQSPPIIENKATVDQITSMNHLPSNCDLLASPISNFTNTNYVGDGLDDDEVGQLLSSCPDLEFTFSDLFDEKTIMSEHLVRSTLDSVYQGYQGNQSMEPIMGADDQFSINSSDGFLEGTTPDGSLYGYPQCYFNSNNSFASQTLNDVKWDDNLLAYEMFQTMSNVTEIFTEQNPDGDLPYTE